jgi:uncharacterized membrane protein HdeD (DUF308 family)
MLGEAMDRLNPVLLGAIAMASLVAGLFFLRFWRQGRDPFFLLFALSFFVEGVNRIVLALSPKPHEGSPAIYLVRLASFLLIIGAIIAKNRAGAPFRRPTTIPGHRPSPPR